jgi:hypothetical protein
VSDVEIIVVVPPVEPVELACGGVPLLPYAEPIDSSRPAATDAGPTMGQRYIDSVSALEVLCTKGGTGALEASGRTLEVKTARRLPASD